MLTITEGAQLQFHTITIEDLVPKNHLVRKIDEVVDFSFIYPLVEDLYCKNNGRNSIDPVVLVKYLLLGYLFGIPSERRIAKETQVNVAYRWFLGLDLFDKVPHHSTISQIRRRKLNDTDIFRPIFEQIVFQCMEKGFVKGNIILTDSTHIKANTSKASEIKVLVEKEVATYTNLLDEYEKIERKNLEEKGMKPKKIRHIVSKKSKMIEKTVSKTDLEAGFLKRKGKPLGMHYLSHQSTDSENGIIVDVAVTAGNVRDSQPYLERIKHLKDKIGLNINAVGVDSAYDTSLIHQVLLEQNIDVYTHMKSHGGRSKAEFTKEYFIYDKNKDFFHCPNNKTLSLRNLQRTEFNIMREYRCNVEDCKKCKYKDMCLAPSQKSRKIQINIFDEAVKKSKERTKTLESNKILNLRQVWCEG